MLSASAMPKAQTRIAAVNNMPPNMLNIVMVIQYHIPQAHATVICNYRYGSVCYCYKKREHRISAPALLLYFPLGCFER